MCLLTNSFGKRQLLDKDPTCCTEWKVYRAYSSLAAATPKRILLVLLPWLRSKFPLARMTNGLRFQSGADCRP
jgi:hypothetical protein